MLEENVLGKLVSVFGIEASGMEYLRSSQNIVYKAEKDELPVIVRISKGRFRTRGEVEAELDWIKFLSERNVKACRPVKNLEGELCYSSVIAGMSYVVTCFEYAPGSEVAKSERDEEMYLRLGRLTGKMHLNAKVHSDEGFKLDRKMWSESRLLNEDLIEQSEYVSDAFGGSVREMISELNTCLKTSDTFGLIHGDIHFGNVFCDGEDLWVFDFDNCEYGYFLQDLATVLWDAICCSILREFPDNVTCAVDMNEQIRPYWEAFLKGYSEMSPLKELDISMLEKFFLLREAVIYVHYHRIYNVEELDESFQAALELMKKNVESRSHQIDLCTISGKQAFIKAM